MLIKKIDELNEEKALLLIDALKCKLREGENARADSNVTSDETRVKSLEYELKGKEEEKQKWQLDSERLKYKHEEEMKLNGNNLKS